ncbi:type I-E CRISPR-associated protein Cas5/CasD [Glycomyces artemisiae]|uniref:CRISPR-associated Cas5e family protein n=1 Tax=Glycomyces artemisiae TaxID=1076443 RepID=A0A2T0USR3_9ACTN|nr:type I-E CRISPR-associated protein Cas5/CasD [Glycomyces artemisiae]PRY60956.1 CRISPR-associated Cas5e family protein [Glycomyces artemisiae]
MGRKTLRLRLAGPMQSWGTSSRFTRRATDAVPSKSGVLGMLAAAKGVRRTEPLTELLDVRFGVRTDQPGTLLRDFQTTRPLDDPAANATLAERFYLSDAIFLAAVEGDADLIDGLADALRRPRFQLFLGRRSCPPSDKVLLDAVALPLEEAIAGQPWLARAHHRRRSPRRVDLEIVRDAGTGEQGDAVQDVPVSFDPRHRRYEWRQVVHDRIVVDNPESRLPHHDPFAAFEV